ncbi:MAG: trimeric autotransporter adhesin [Pseudonocardiales bacterium]|nr:trimeric autotransporter adhesin [Pseudonocardiales bacterium]
MASKSLHFLLFGEDVTAGKVFKKVAGEAEASGAKMSGAFIKHGALAAAGLAIGLADAAKKATKYQSDMLLLHTQAGVSMDEVNKQSGQLLKLAPQVATGADEMAVSLYHIESTGLRGAKGLEAVRIAAEGANVGHADLEATTNALTSTIASGIPGVQDMAAAMGSLNAIVGAGDMKMQDLNDALASGVLTVVKGYGLSLNDVGAALATFGDNNIRGADAATMLRMAVQALSTPAAQGADTLKRLGLSTTKLRDDMAKGGLSSALEDLYAHLKAAKVGTTEVGGVLTEVFGKKAGPGLAVLIGQIDRYRLKTEEVARGGKTFNQSWNDWLKSNEGQMKTLEANVSSLEISIGNKLLPVINDGLHIINDNATAIEAVVVGVVGFKLAAAGAAVAASAWNASAKLAIPLSRALGFQSAATASAIESEVVATRHLAAARTAGAASMLRIAAIPAGLAVGIAQQNKQLATKPKLWWEDRNPFNLQNWKPFSDKPSQPKNKPTTKAADDSAAANKAAADAAAAETAATKAQAEAARQAAADITAEAKAAASLAAGLDFLNGRSLDVKSAQLGFLDSVHALTEGVKENGHALDDNSAKGRTNQEAVLSSIKAAQAHAVALEKAGQSSANAARHYLTDEAALRKQAVAAGFSKDAVDALIKKYGGVPKSIKTDIEVEDKAARAAVAAHQAALHHIPNSVSTSLAVVGAGAARAVIRSVIDYANGQVATIHVVTQTSHGVSGGRQAFASGTTYAPGGWADVGEQGRERVFLPRGSRVASASQVRAMDSSSRGRGGDTHVHVHVAQPLASADQIARAVVPALAQAERNGMRMPW